MPSSWPARMPASSARASLVGLRPAARHRVLADLPGRCRADHGRHGGRRRFRRSARPGRRYRRAGRSAPRVRARWWRRRRPVEGSSQGALVTRPGDVGLVEGDRDGGEPAGALAERTGVHLVREPVGDDLGQVLGGGVGAGEVGFVVEVAVVQLRRPRCRAPGWRVRCRRRCCRRRARRRRKVASTRKVAPCRRCAGPKTSPRKLWAIMRWSRTVMLNNGCPSRYGACDPSAGVWRVVRPTRTSCSGRTGLVQA